MRDGLCGVVKGRGVGGNMEGEREGMGGWGVGRWGGLGGVLGGWGCGGGGGFWPAMDEGPPGSGKTGCAQGASGFAKKSKNRDVILAGWTPAAQQTEMTMARRLAAAPELFAPSPPRNRICR